MVRLPLCVLKVVADVTKIKCDVTAVVRSAVLKGIQETLFSPIEVMKCNFSEKLFVVRLK